MRLLESASLGISDVTNRIEEYLPEAEATSTVALRDRGHDPAAADDAATDRMLAGLRHLGHRGRMPQDPHDRHRHNHRSGAQGEGRLGVGHDVAGAV